MKTIIVYYTFGGSTKKEAEQLAIEQNATLCRVREQRQRSFLASFIPGGFQAMRRKSVSIKPLNVDLNDYDSIIIGCPVWAEYPAPAFNSILKLLSAGKEVQLFLCSGGSGTKKTEAETRALVESYGCTVTDYRDILTGIKPGKLKE